MTTLPLIEVTELRPDLEVTMYTIGDFQRTLGGKRRTIAINTIERRDSSSFAKRSRYVNLTD